MSKFKNLITKIFGNYTPPEWPRKLAQSKKARKAFKISLISLGGLVAAFILFLVGLFVYNFIQSKKPVEMRLSYYVDSPNIQYEAKDTLYVNFTGSAADLDDIGQDVSSKVTITPAINGKWIWRDESNLVFEPYEDWNVGAEYKVTMSNSLFPSHVKLNDKLTFNFSTADFTTYIRDASFIIDDVDPKKKYIAFEIYGNFPFVKEDFSSKITIKPDMKNPKNGTVENRNYSSTVSFNDSGRVAYVVSEVIGIPSTDLRFDITVDSGLKCAIGNSTTKSKIEDFVYVSGSTNYAGVKNITSNFLLDDNQEYNQIITVETSAKIDVENLDSKMEIYILPKDKPALSGSKAQEKYRWSDTDEVIDDVLKLSTKVPLQAYETETKYETVHSYAIDVPEYSYLYIRLKAGAHFYGDYYLAEDYEKIIRVGAYPKEASFVSEGNLISLRGSHKIPILARGVSEIDFKVWRLKPDEINHIVSQSNGNLKNFKFSSYKFDEYNVSELVYSNKIKTSVKDPRKVSYENFDFSDYLDTVPSKDLKYGLFMVNMSGRNISTTKKLIIITDQSMIIKKAKGSDLDIFVQSISTGLPIVSSLIEVVGLNGTIIARTTTDSTGHATVPASYKQYETPVAITATYGNDMAFVPFSFNGRTVDYSDFDVGGIYGAQDPDKVSAYIFSDRGIYRPGDEIRFGAIVKAGDWEKSLRGTPFAYVIRDPNGNEIIEKEFNLNEDGFEEIKYSTKDYSPTGEYTLYLYLKKAKTWRKVEFEKILIASETVKVEEFMPDTLQINASIEPLSNAGWIKPQNLTGIVKLKNLFGNDAVGNDVKADIKLTPGYLRFAKYKDYRFNDPFISKDSYEVRLSDTVTDDKGYARFDIDMSSFAPASYRLSFNADGFEKESGRSVSSTAQVYISPLDYILGVKADGDLSYINKGSTRMLKIIAVGPELDTLKVDDVTLSLVENRYVSVLVKQPNGVYKYQSVKKEYPVKSEKISIPKDGLEYYLPVDIEGDFVLKLSNKDGIEFTSTAFSVVGKQNLQRSLSRTAEIEVKMSKSDFKIGEEAELLVKAPYAGSGLICVERDKVYSYKWFSSSEASSVQKIRIPEGIEGNGYITIMYLRDYNSEEVYMSPFCYAAVPFSVSLDAKKNNISLEIPEVVKPDTDYKITYSSSKKGKIVIFAVDEGILQVAKYKTPDPLSLFFQKRALEVTTAQTADLIMPEYNVLKTLSAAGGGGDYDDYLSHNLNPFKKKQNAPVAYWSGVMDTDSTKRTVTYHIPSYFNGKLRVMAVAVSDDSIGVTEEATNVRDDYIISTTYPNFAAPGDEFEVSVVVTNNDAGSGENANVKLTAVADKGVTLIGNTSVDLKISEGRDATYIFKCKATDTLGNCDIVFKAQGKNNSSKMTASLSVRPSMPYQVWLESGRVHKTENKNDSVNVERELYEEFATRKVDLSYLPLGFAKGLNFYLEKYPYGCSEQVTSAAFPYFFPNLMKETGKTASEAKEAIENVIDILQSRQKDDGTIGYWTYKSDSYPELDAYCALFLTIAKERGYYVPQNFMNKLLNALKREANETGYAAAFSIYVLTRNEIVTTSYLEHISKTLTNSQKMDLAGIYTAASYKLLYMDSEGKKILSKVKKGMQREYNINRFENNLYYDASILYLLSEYYPEYLSIIGDELLEAIEDAVIGRSYTTISSAFTLMAIESYLNAVPTAATGKFTVSQDFGKDIAKKPMDFKGENVFSSEFEGNAKNLLLTNSEKTNLFYQVTQAGFMKNIPAEETKDNGLEITRQYSATLGGKAQTSFTRGDSVYVTIRIRTTNKNYVNNIALVDMLPSCFEANIESIRAEDGTMNPDFVDIREDRVIFYCDAGPEVKEITYKVNAITNGTFIVPPLFAQAMYDNHVKALKPYDKIVVKKADEK